MKKRTLILCIMALLILAACGKTECKKDIDCNRAHFTAKCVEKKCVYTPIPNECGNGECETGENKCNCEDDCGTCAGKVPNSQYLVMQCTPDNKECLEDVASGQVKPFYSSSDVSSAGDKFKIDTIYNLPFNLKKDTFGITIMLSEQGASNKDEHMISAELTATTKDKRTITLTRHDINKYLWTEGSTIQEELILDFPTAELEGELTNLALKIQYEYSITQAGKKITKQATITHKYKEKMIFVKPAATYPCPASCDDKNPGTKDSCGAQTSYFCKHEPVSNACGNYKCDGNENKCTCMQDCGICAGSAGNFLDYTCQSNKCVTILKTGATIQPNSLFDDRSLGPVQLNNNYQYNNPFDIKKDTFDFDFKVYRADPKVSDVIIETIRILEGSQQIIEVEVGKTLSDKPTEVKIKIPSIIEPEEEHAFTIGVWYKYTVEGQEKAGNFQKQLGKITLINPG
jgi:hypothetical protein